ncbi:MAG TPA: TIM barrel protein [Roseiflexaceae bacterium]|nr:TIM barrel protein [Roseiflexaceae bacterium]
MTFPFKRALNASTLFPFALDLPQQIETAAQAGYEGIEIWMRDLEAYVAAGGSLAMLRARIADTGLTVANAIAFFAWADADAEVRARGMVQAEREMHMLAELGCAAVAAPPFGNVAGVPLESIAEAYALLAALGRRIGVEPYLEFWGRAARLSRLSEALYVALESGVTNAQLLLDPFHMYTGGSDVSGIGYLAGHAIGIVHVNDYPATPAREVITDAERVFPGEGIAPSRRLARLLYDTGSRFPLA